MSVKNESKKIDKVVISANMGVSCTCEMHPTMQCAMHPGRDFMAVFHGLD